MHIWNIPGPDEDGVVHSGVERPLTCAYVAKGDERDLTSLTWSQDGTLVAVGCDLMDGREGHGGLVLELKIEGHGDVATVLEDGDVDEASVSVEFHLYGLEVGLVRAMGASGAVERDRDRETVLEVDDGALSLARSEKTTKRVDDSLQTK